MAILLFDEVELLDVAGVCSVLSAAGRQWNFRPFKIHAVGTRAGLVETRSQVRLEAKLTLSDVPSPEVLVVPGGYGARRALSDSSLLGWLARAGPAATHVLGIGNGLLLLGAAGVLGDRSVAAGRDLGPLLHDSAPGATLNHEARALESRGLFTAQGSAAAADAALTLVSSVLGAKQARAVAETLGIPLASAPDAGVTIAPAEGVTIVEKG